MVLSITDKDTETIRRRTVPGSHLLLDLLPPPDSGIKELHRQLKMFRQLDTHRQVLLLRMLIIRLIHRNNIVRNLSSIFDCCITLKRTCFNLACLPDLNEAGQPLAGAGAQPPGAYNAVPVYGQPPPAAYGQPAGPPQPEAAGGRGYGMIPPIPPRGAVNYGAPPAAYGSRPPPTGYPDDMNSRPSFR
jgi:hypothetical protein